MVSVTIRGSEGAGQGRAESLAAEAWSQWLFVEGAAGELGCLGSVEF